MMAGSSVARTAARVLLVDADQCVLLMHERRDIGSERSHWITPGGGVEDGESLVQAAVRELYEETGLRLELDPAAVPLMSDRVSFQMAGSRFDQTNHYFFARCPSGLAVSPAAHTEIETLVVLGHRWWSLPELAASAVEREPVGIVDILYAQLAREESP
jgi:8-oxo-dGTP pyrophosphatase MutT (NUDIX family)